MKYSVTAAIVVVLAIGQFGCGDDSEPQNSPTQERDVGEDANDSTPIALPAVAQMVDPAGGVNAQAFLCENSAPEFTYELEDGDVAEACANGVIYATFEYDVAQDFYLMRAGVTEASTSPQAVRISSTTTGSVEEAVGDTSDLVERIPENTETTVTTEAWTITFTLGSDSMSITEFDPAG